jgi:hypothetical protein
LRHLLKYQDQDIQLRSRVMCHGIRFPRYSTFVHINSLLTVVKVEVEGRGGQSAWETKRMGVEGAVVLSCRPDSRVAGS